MTGKILMIACLASFSSSAGAQRVRIGLEAGVTSANAHYKFDNPVAGDDDGNYDGLLGAKFGGFLDARLSDNFHIQPGLYVSSKGYRTDNSLNQDVNVRLNYVELPLYFHATFGPRRIGQFFIGGGPYVAGAISGKYKNLDTDDDGDLEFGNNFADDDFRRGDAGLNFDLGFQSSIGIFGRVNFGYGLVNITPDETNLYDFKQYNRTLSITAGWLFGHRTK